MEEGIINSKSQVPNKSHLSRQACLSLSTHPNCLLNFRSILNVPVCDSNQFNFIQWNLCLQHQEHILLPLSANSINSSLYNRKTSTIIWCSNKPPASTNNQRKRFNSLSLEEIAELLMNTGFLQQVTITTIIIRG